MKSSAWLWIIALVLTLASARWQRVSGPTYALSGEAVLGGTTVEYVLDRTHAGPGDEAVRIAGLPDGRRRDPRVEAGRLEGGVDAGPDAARGRRARAAPCRTSRRPAGSGTASGSCAARRAW